MVKTFSQFITEARRWNEVQLTLSKDYSRDYGDFYFEEGCHDNTTPHNQKQTTQLFVKW